MTEGPLDKLLEQLAAGDLQAAEQVFRTYEPYLRLVVRRSLPGRLRSKFDSIDVVQSVWVHVLRGMRECRWQFLDKPHLLAFLVQIARRRLTTRLRHHHVAVEREQPWNTELEAVLHSAQPAPSEMAQAGELWERMLALCPPEHHVLLELRRSGLTMDEIAARTGLHEGSVRRVLRGLARQLALRTEPIAAASGEAS
jgi:RNA polymerase sigma-70 factor (ECF subfamily)